jgi:hypothetical protein
MPPARKRFSLGAYDLTSYDANFCLKAPLMLWLVILYLARAILLPFVSGVSSFGGARDGTSLTQGLFGVEDSLPAALALTVFLALLRRTPSASQLWRSIWSFGRPLLAAAAVADLAISLYRFLQITDANALRTEWLLLACLADGYVLVYLFRSRRVRDVFNDFPAPDRPDTDPLP